MRIRNGFEEFICLPSNVSRVMITTSFSKPGLKTGAENNTFCLKPGQDLENRAAYLHQEFPGVPSGVYDWFMVALILSTNYN